MTVSAFVTGLAGTMLTPAERAFLRESEPWGLIVFKRNIDTPSQVARLTASFRDAVGRDAPVLVDQEGGRVQRLGPPHWPAYPAGAAYGRVYDRDPALGRTAARLGALLIAADLVAVGIDVDCLPIADVPVAGANPVIGDRAYGETAEKVASLARAVADGLLAGGVLPVLKHIPGHGRAGADSHDALPVVESDRATLMRTDFAAFQPLSDLPLGMTAHVVYTAFDPIAPATTSATVVRDVIRGLLGFRGLLMSDDVSMEALSGSIAARASAAISAGCDAVLHCNGKLEEMEAVASAVPVLIGAAAARADAALARRKPVLRHDLAALRAEWAALMDAPAGAGRAVS
ncbi:MAG: beta-N-acetylhexosaminidase [Xanthobacteraceae bacterium]